MSTGAPGETLHELVRRTVTEHLPADHAERESIEVFLREYARLADPFSQQLDPVHVTGSAIVVGPRGVILLKHKRLGMWLQPGGHVDPGEAPWEAAVREAEEETGLPVVLESAGHPPALVHVDVHDGGRGHTHLDLRYVVHVDGDPDPAPPAGESQDVYWFAWPAAIERASDDRLKGLLSRLAP